MASGVKCGFRCQVRLQVSSVTSGVKCGFRCQVWLSGSCVCCDGITFNNLQLHRLPLSCMCLNYSAHRFILLCNTCIYYVTCFLRVPHHLQIEQHFLEVLRSLANLEMIRLSRPSPLYVH